MHTIEPFYNWLHLYDSSEDERSPFFGKEYNQFEFTETIYNHYIHPNWDSIESPTLYIKILAVDYTMGFAIIELFGEWNDAINNDIMFLKREITDVLIENGINQFILIGENILNFHNSDDCYYEEWYNDIQDSVGWIAVLNLRAHVIREMNQIHLDHFLNYLGEFEEINWRIYEPQDLYSLIERSVNKRLV